ncbi:MAG: hypothetical protein NVSMB47_09720 [Polyangiales bacterium]
MTEPPPTDPADEPPDDAPDEPPNDAPNDDLAPAARGARRRPPPNKVARTITFAVIAAVVVYVLAKRWHDNRTHHVTYRALADTEACRVKLDYDPGPRLDPVEKQTGVVTPWHGDFEANEETELSLRVFGDPSCASIRCEIEVDGIVIARKTQPIHGEGVDSASCRALAVTARLPR